MTKAKTGSAGPARRPRPQRNIRVRGIPRQTIDVEKLARAFLDVADQLRLADLEAEIAASAELAHDEMPADELLDHASSLS